MSDVVPFGKYKGQPVEAMVQDRQYIEWLTAQSWFRDRYQAIYNIVVNNFQEPSETPEHNALQVLFLEESFRKRFLNQAYNRDFDRVSVKFEHHGFDVYLDGDIWKEGAPEGTKDWDKSRACHVEIKPSIGDDYPAILRQMKTAAIRRPHQSIRDIDVERMILFLETYSGVGATEDQFIAFFESEEIKVVFLDEVT